MDNFLERLTKSDPAVQQATTLLLKKIRQYGGVAKFVEQCDNKEEVALVKRFRDMFSTWDKDNVAFNSQWKPSYARHGVIKLKEGEICRKSQSQLLT